MLDNVLNSSTSVNKREELSLFQTALVSIIHFLLFFRSSCQYLQGSDNIPFQLYLSSNKKVFVNSNPSHAPNSIKKPSCLQLLINKANKSWACCDKEELLFLNSFHLS